MLKKILKNRTALGIASIFLAFVISFGITPLLSKAMKSQVEIVRANKNIKKGEKITSDKITKVKVGGYNLPQSVIKKSDEIVGKYAKENIYKDDYFLSSKISSEASSTDPYLNELNGKVAVSATIKTFASGLSGKLQSGDIVSVLSSDEDKNVFIIPELKYVEVLAVTDKEGADREERDIEKEELPATVTLLVGEEQAEKLVEYEQNGDIHIALAYRGLEKEKYLKVQEEYIKGLQDSEGGKEIGEIEKDTNAEVEYTQDSTTQVQRENSGEE